MPCLWRAVVRVKDDVMLGLKWSVVRGEGVCLWADAWVGDLGPLCYLSSTIISKDEIKLRVCDLVD